MNSIESWLKAIAVMLIIAFIGEVIFSYGMINFIYMFGGLFMFAWTSEDYGNVIFVKFCNSPLLSIAIKSN